MSIFPFFTFLLTSIALMLLLLVLVRRRPYAKRLSLTNDIAGFYVGVIGALYGVLIGFVVLVVWTRFDQAEELVENEATAIANIYVLIGQLPDPGRTQVRTSLEHYAQQVIQQEWAMMEAGQGSSQQALNTLLQTWGFMGAFNPGTLREQVLMDEAFDQMSELHKTRRLRLLANEKTIPVIFWVVLIIGGFLTAGSTILFGVELFRFHGLKLSILTTLIYLLLYAIWEIDKPFRHNVRISSDPFTHIMVSRTTDSTNP